MDWLYWHEGVWTTRETALLSLKDHSFWMGNTVFDGARAFNGWAPDLDQHCARAIRSAERMLLKPKISPAELTEHCREGAARFPDDAELYIRPMFFARGGFIVPDPDTTECAIAIHRLPLPDAKGFSACISPYRRPYADMAPTDAKATCLYPNMQRALSYAAERGFGNALVRTTEGAIAEFASANLMIVKDGIIYTPAPDGTFLAGITRSRVMDLLRAEGIEVVESTLSEDDVMGADEVFSTGNYGKVLPTYRVNDRTFGVGPITRKVRQLYWDFAETCSLK